jgi:hypothetical protein
LGKKISWKKKIIQQLKARVKFYQESEEFSEFLRRE